MWARLGGDGRYELARISGVNQPTIQRVLSGETAAPGGDDW